ncbi:hypothetical protein LIER_01762 [Lithospermum erythrorhizon]|uniref:Integrase catalytic domain-containing protein n=1 Tax=Lithospermum erythrorhizon TaxID=34254 RepID=A0AAV3NPK0_LITER
MNALSADIGKGYLFTKNANDLWNELKEQFGGILKPNDVVNFDGEERMMQFLIRLGEEYDTIRNQILLMDLLPSVAKTYSMVADVEKRRVVQGNVVEMSDNVVMQTRDYPEKTQFNSAKRSGFRKKEDTPHLKFIHCRKVGHVKFGCFKIVGFPKWWGNTKRNSSFNRPRNANVNNVEYQEDEMQNTPLNHIDEVVNFTNYAEFAGNLVVGFSNACDKMSCGSWIVDNGASVHVCSDINLFHSINNMSYSISVKLPDDTVRVVKSGGVVKLNSNIMLTDCLYVPFFNYNLLSDTKSLELGHCSPIVMKHVQCLNQMDCVDMDIYLVCPLSKQHRQVFHISQCRASGVFQLVHVDLWGPYKVANRIGARYFVTIVEDYSRSTWTFMINFKTQTCDIIKRFCKMINTQFDKMIKSVRRDNGEEFVSMEFNSLVTDPGIIYQKICSYTPQQNDRMERKHKHLLQVARTLMFQLLNWQTPYEALHSKPLIFDHLKVFGCLCFASYNTPHKTEFQERAHLVVFLGYPPNLKAYRLYDLKARKVIVSRNVVFHEEIFSYKIRYFLANDKYIDQDCLPCIPIHYPLPNFVPCIVPDTDRHEVDQHDISNNLDNDNDVHDTSSIPTTSTNITSNNNALVPTRVSTKFKMPST